MPVFFQEDRPRVGRVLAVGVVLCVLAYIRTLWLPFISDDYLQIALGRRFGPVEGWSALAADALYRCRATSLLLTFWTERLLGLDPFFFHLTSLALHIVNTWLVFALGAWNAIGWRVSAWASFFFAVCHQHQEAVSWYASLPELMVFLFGAAAFWSWVRWLAAGTWPCLAATFLCYGLALLSKESAVAIAALAALAAVTERQVRRAAWPLAAMVAIALAYYLAAWVHRTGHLHFNDGTFVLSWGFPLVLLRSIARLMWFWGVLSAIALAVWKRKAALPIAVAAGAWIAVTLLPYSFLNYMPFVPSRHTYFATAGWSWLVGAAFVEVWRRYSGRSAVAWSLAAILVAHHCGYITVRKYRQMFERGQPTELLVDLARHKPGQVRVSCFPYPDEVAHLALDLLSVEGGRARFVRTSHGSPDSVNLCNSTAH